jgi:hypothetical protein
MFEISKSSMKGKFAVTDFGGMRYFLGIEVKQYDCGIFIHQQKHAKEILTRFTMEHCNMVCSHIAPESKLARDENCRAMDETKHKQMVGCLMYLIST